MLGGEAFKLVDCDAGGENAKGGKVDVVFGYEAGRRLRVGRWPLKSAISLNGSPVGGVTMGGSVEKDEEVC